MRHRHSGRKLNRTTSHRKAMISNMATSLVEHKKIKTTVARAKEARRIIERLITFAKKGDLAARRQVLKIIRDKEAVKILFDEIAPQYEDRNGGYTRIVKLGQRLGDGASLAYLELVGFEGVRKEKKKKKEKEKEAETEQQPEASEE
ncbi:50S ribosomal protein L17 [candidate division KSB1 bacterium]|nr:50S ribosomal protein L17 [candidate division KSB1 bacterium]